MHLSIARRASRADGKQAKKVSQAPRKLKRILDLGDFERRANGFSPPSQ